MKPANTKAVARTMKASWDGGSQKSACAKSQVTSKPYDLSVYADRKGRAGRRRRPLFNLHSSNDDDVRAIAKLLGIPMNSVFRDMVSDWLRARGADLGVPYWKIRHMSTPEQSRLSAMWHARKAIDPYGNEQSREAYEQPA